VVVGVVDLLALDRDRAVGVAGEVRWAEVRRQAFPVGLIVIPVGLVHRGVAGPVLEIGGGIPGLELAHGLDVSLLVARLAAVLLGMR
jgi:hypothetical protein